MIRLSLPPSMYLPGLIAAVYIVAAAAAPIGTDRTEGLIRGIGLTRLEVYDQRPAPDGLMSGSPHVHALTDEGYYVISGRGRVELHDLKEGYRSVELAPGRYLQFPPGALHRLVNSDHLVILVVMGNAGLAERGDARIYFGKAVDDEPDEYARLAGLAGARGLDGALDRRDAAVKAYLGLLGLWTTDRQAYFQELGRFIGVHKKAAAALRAGAGPAAGQGHAAPFFHVPPDEPALGMCGLLWPVTKLEAVGSAKEPGARKKS